MPAYLSREVADTQGRVFPQASADRANPARRLTPGLPACNFQEPLQRCAKAFFGCRCFASVTEVPRLPPGTTSDPPHHGQSRNQPASKPVRIELDLDLFESKRCGRIAMSRPRAIEDRGRPGDKRLADVSLVQIGAHHKERNNRPVVGVLRHAGVAPVDDPSDRDSAEASQHQISYPSRMAWPLIKCCSASRQEKRPGWCRDLESVQYKICARR